MSDDAPKTLMHMHMHMQHAHAHAACTCNMQHAQDPAKIPVEEIINIWREESEAGRYLNKLIWGAQGLEQAIGEMTE